MQKENRKMGMSFIVFVLFFVIGAASLFRGIENHETWRIVTALAGCLLCAAFCYLIVYTIIKNSKKIVAAKPAKRRSH